MVVTNRAQQTENRKLKVLVVDDDEVIRELFKRFLGRQGYSVFTATDGLNALDKVKKDNYDMLILDLKMPKMHGMELLNRIKGLKKNLIIIVITGYATIDTAKEAIRQGCFDYIIKPFDIEDVNVIIRRAFQMRRLVEEQARLKEQIQITERLAALAQMGAGVAHEVNTVLTSIRLFLEMLKPKLSSGKESKNVDLLLGEAERVEKLIFRFLKFTKPAEAEFIKTDINSLVERSLQFLKHRLKKQEIRIFKKLSYGLPKIFCDPAKMEEVFLNIFSNGIDAMPKGGILTIETQSKDSNIAIVVSDTGRGIPQENMKLLYNPFFSTKPHGTGLGLSIVHRIIDEHKGRIRITSGENRGTTVKVELPVLDKVESSKQREKPVK